MLRKGLKRTVACEADDQGKTIMVNATLREAQSLSA